jgi:hypothetical protein
MDSDRPNAWRTTVQAALDALEAIADGGKAPTAGEVVQLEACTEHVKLTVDLLDRGIRGDQPCYDAHAAAPALRELVAGLHSWAGGVTVPPAIVDAARAALRAFDLAPTQ